MKRKSYDIKKSILNYIKDSSLTYTELERKVNTCFSTIKNSCKELEEFGLVNIKKVEKHQANGKPSYLVSITEKGREVLEKRKKY
ncbi:MAG: winged helix-turn-helix domain-containing protein [Candidatus Woesearchaeota archaeon]